MDHSVQTVTEASVASISQADLNRMMDKFPAFANAMYIAQVINEGIMRAWIVSMGRRTSIQRVAHLTCELYIRMRGIGLCDEDEIELPLSQVVLADALGMTSVHVNRVLKELKQSNAMSFRRGHLSITNPQKLVKIAGFDENYLHRRESGKRKALD
jgi:CRP-like cAMP-binding protein